MVFESTLNGRKVFVCGECKLAYLDRRIALDCEAFCKKFNACSLKITKNAVGSVESPAKSH